ncbi:MAG: hypothetical protein ACYTF1_03740 [Planctomycetota bacterium]|jgi:uncharacterized membrane protein YcjF (UPF0283 family)
MNDENAGIEELLAGYRPKGPPAGLRERIMQSVEFGRSPWKRAGWMAVAAMLVLSIGLNFAAESVTRDTVDMLQVQHIEWTPEAEEAAQLLNGDGWGRQYVAFTLVVDSYQVETYSPGVGVMDVTGDLR